MAIQEGFQANIVRLSNSLEVISLDVNFWNPILRLILCYLPDSHKIDYAKYAKAFLEELDSFIPRSPFLFMGDFNLPNVDWDKEVFPSGSVYEYFHKFYLHNQPMLQIVPFATRGANTLDWIFINIPNFFSSPRPLINLDRSDNVIIKFEYFSNIN